MFRISKLKIIFFISLFIVIFGSAFYTRANYDFYQAISGDEDVSYFWIGKYEISKRIKVIKEKIFRNNQNLEAAEGGGTQPFRNYKREEKGLFARLFSQTNSSLKKTTQKLSMKGFHRKNSSSKLQLADEVVEGDLTEESNPGVFQGKFDRTLPAAIINNEYCIYLNPLWSVAPYQWTLQSGLLPKGYSLDNTNGFLCGLSDEGGVWQFEVRILDGSLNFILVDYELIVQAFDEDPKDSEKIEDLALLTDSIPSGFVGIEYFVQLQATGGKLPYTWSITDIPSGLSFQSSYGILYSAPLDDGTFNFNISVTDNAGTQVFKSYSLEVDTSPLYITTTSLPSGIIGQDYSHLMQSQGGKPPYSWQVISGVIPEGLNFDTQTALLSGIPTDQQSEKLRFQVNDTSGKVDIVELPISITGGPLTIVTDQLVSGTVGSTYYATLDATGGTLPYIWSIVSGALPDGIELQAAGVIIGTPQESFDSSLEFEVSDSSSISTTLSLNLKIDPSPLTIVTDFLQEGHVGIAYQDTVNAIGGTPPYSFSLTSGELPADVTLSADGTISGTSQTTAINNVTIEAVDASDSDVDQDFVFIINEETLTILTVDPDIAIYQQSYSFPLQAQGGTPPYTWTLTAGALPNNLNLSAAGIISGTPEETGIFPFNMQVMDNFDNLGTKSIFMSVIQKELEILTTSLPDSNIGSSYNFTLQADGGIAPYAWSIYSGGLPDGLILDGNTGVISGAPLESGEFNVAFELKDTISASTIENFSIKVSGPPLQITTSSLNDGEVGIFYNTILNAEGGTPPYSWNLTSGSLPDGLNPDISGKITGIPQKGETSSFIFEVEDADNNRDSKALSIAVQTKPLSILTTSLADGKVGLSYMANLQAAGGVLPYTWEVALGQLPEKLTLSPTGLISGEPTESVTSSVITFKVSDGDAQSTQTQLAITIKPADLESVSNLIAAGSDQKVGLAWKNPAGPNYDRTEIIRKIGSFPQDPSDGNSAYNGTANNVVDSGLVNDVTYYYTAFAINTAGGFASVSSGAQITATPSAVTLSGPKDPFVDEVISYSPLDPGSAYGASSLPNVILGPPKGAGQWIGSLDVVSIHTKDNTDGGASGPYGGNIVLKFSDNIVVNGPGVDFTVFENAFQTFGTDSYFIEPSVVDVSQDGVNFYRFPFDYVPHYDPGGLIDYSNPFAYPTGFAGVKPVYSNGLTPDPTDPSVSGGDQFDLSSLPVTLTWIQYIKITSTGNNWLTDVNGDKVLHLNGPPTWSASGTGNSGSDLDAVSAVNY